MFKSIDIELNTNCDLRCSYCPNLDFYRGTNYMDESLFLKIIKELADMEFSGRVTPSLYGEPLLFPDIEMYLQHIRESLPSANIVVFTNGTKLKQSKYDRLEKYVNQFRVTRHGKYAVEASGEKVYIRDFNNNVVLSNRCGLVDHPQAKGRHKACWGITNQAFVNYRGEFLLCCNDFHGERNFGNVFNNTLTELWEGDEINLIKDEMRNNIFSLNICKRCNHVRY